MYSNTVGNVTGKLASEINRQKVRAAGGSSAHGAEKKKRTPDISRGFAVEATFSRAWIGRGFKMLVIAGDAVPML